MTVSHSHVYLSLKLNSFRLGAPGVRAAELWTLVGDIHSVERNREEAMHLESRRWSLGLTMHKQPKCTCKNALFYVLHSTTLFSQTNILSIRVGDFAHIIKALTLKESCQGKIIMLSDAMLARVKANSGQHWGSFSLPVSHLPFPLPNTHTHMKQKRKVPEEKSGELA